jgi:glycosyltransferase involved in cell wall biosynthesis
MTYPLVSVVVPSYNQGRYLGAALDSLLFQEYPNLEVLICNHGSTDDTSDVISEILHSYDHDRVSFLDRVVFNGSEKPEIVRRSKSRYPRGRTIRVFESGENIGGTASYNVGFRHATGQYGTYLVGDDRLAPGFIKRLVLELEETGSDYVYADMALVDDSDRIVQILRKPDYSFQRSLCDWYHLGVAKLYRLDLHRRVGYYDESFRNANDYDMAVRFALAGATFKHIPEVLYFVRRHTINGSDEPCCWRPGGYENQIRESTSCAERARKALEEGLAPEKSLNQQGC